MIKYLLCIALMFTYSMTLANSNPPGFLWYNVIRDPAPQKPQNQRAPNIQFNQLSYSKRDEVLHFYTMEALHRARQTKSMEDMRTYIALQDYWLKESSRFRNLFEQTMRYYPEYDYQVTHPTSSIGTKILDKTRAQNNKAAILSVHKTHGLLFFYRSQSPYDTQQIPVLQDFCERFNLSLIPVSVDGKNNHALPNSRKDTGQAQSLGVRFFPAILLVNPRTHTTVPVAYGFTTQDILERNLVHAIHNFKEEEL